jgi:hypothetical protein
MLGEAILSFQTTWALWTALAVSIAAALIAAMRRPAAPRLTYAAIAIGLALLALAAGSPIWLRPVEQQVTVMVDLSPSTRTAGYRDRAALERRIHELLRDIPYRMQFFSDGVQEVEPGSTRLSDLPADHTTYVPPSAAAVLLFTDGRFPIPKQSPPTYVVIDSGLEDPEDAAVTDLEIREKEFAVSINNAGGSRRLTVTGATSPSPTTVPTGSLVIPFPLADSASKVSAELSPGDAWPENDALSAIVPPPERYERWWVGRSSPGGGWRTLLPEELPTDAAAYLSTSVIVLDNIAASELTDLQQQRLKQYIQDLGGGVLIIGGDRAFAAGGYQGTILDSLSPLASNPPLPTNHWILLADGSGSMSSPVAGSTRWQFITDAMTQVLPHLPPEDVVSVGSFAESLQWWVEGKPVREAASLPFPPPSAYPHGPTNLQPALEAIARSADGKMPVHLLVLSDFDTQISNPEVLSIMLKSKNINLHLLAIGEGSALAPLRQISTATQGSVVTELDPTLWARSAAELARAAGSSLLEREPIKIASVDRAIGGLGQTTGPWNRVWLKESATKLAEARREGETIPMAARWNVGEGRVVATAFNPSSETVEQFVGLVSRPPHDPRFRVAWNTGARLRIAIDASDEHGYLNGQHLTFEFSDGSRAGKAIPQTILQSGPGRYELSVPAPRSPGIATVRSGGQVIARVAVAGRYAPEFEAIGNDHAAMQELAGRSGGEVIPPNRTNPLDIHWPSRPVPIASFLACTGALLTAIGLIWWRVS